MAIIMCKVPRKYANAGVIQRYLQSKGVRVLTKLEKRVEEQEHSIIVDEVSHQLVTEEWLKQIVSKFTGVVATKPARGECYAIIKVDERHTNLVMQIINKLSKYELYKLI